MLLNAEARRLFGRADANPVTHESSIIPKTAPAPSTQTVSQRPIAIERESPWRWWIALISVAAVAWAGGETVARFHMASSGGLATAFFKQTAWPFMFTTLAAVVIAIVASRSQTYRVP